MKTLLLLLLLVRCATRNLGIFLILMRMAFAVNE